jgi:hypothetical protein
MTASPKLIIHAGHPKCGSTAVRSLLRHNGPMLAREGYYLLGDHFKIDPEGSAVDWPLWYIEQAAEQPAGLLAEQLRRAVEAHRGYDIKALILSAENLSEPAKAALFDPAFGDFETHLIYYMRRQDHFLVASWRQWALKRGTPFEHHVARRLAERKPSFEQTLAFWESRIGRHRIHARFLDPRFLEGGELATDLFSALGCGPPAMPAAPEINASPDRAVLLYLQKNHQLFESVHDDRPIQLLSSLDLGPIVKLSMDRHLQRTVSLAYEAENQRILERFMAPSSQGLPVIVLDAAEALGDYALTERDRDRLDQIFARLVARTA